VSRDGLTLTCWLGEHDHAGAAFLADALLGAFERHGVRASCLLRGVEGFGAKHRLQSERLLTLSEDLPLVAIAADARERIEALLDDVADLQRTGLRTLAPVRLLDGELAAPELAHAPAGEAVKLTVHLDRGERAAGRPAHLAVVGALHDAGVAGATVLLGVDGTARGARRRARFLARNAHVPALVVSVGEPARIAAALPRIEALLARPLATLERVRVCKRDGTRLALPAAPPDAGDGSPEPWQQLTVYASEQSRHHGRTLHTTLVRRLRAEGAAGATALRGVWGYHGDHAPHGDRMWSLRRRVPVVTVVVDRPRAAAQWFATLDACTDETGLVTSETVRALP
jgi:PII-like signaling protein